MQNNVRTLTLIYKIPYTSREILEVYTYSSNKTRIMKICSMLYFILLCLIIMFVYPLNKQETSLSGTQHFKIDWHNYILLHDIMRGKYQQSYLLDNDKLKILMF